MIRAAVILSPGCRLVASSLVVVFGAVSTLGGWSQATPRAQVSVWYRGVPAGTPRLADLEAIRAHGFTAVTWPIQQLNGLAELRTMANATGLGVLVRSGLVPLSMASAMKPAEAMDVPVDVLPTPVLHAILWRAVAHGARTISFDSSITAWWDAPKPPAWVSVATPVEGLDVVLLSAPRSWVLIATHTGPTPADTYVGLPAGVPAAEWLGLFDGRTISMLNQRVGPRWHVVLAPGDVRVYLIDKAAR